MLVTNFLNILSNTSYIGWVLWPARNKEWWNMAKSLARRVGFEWNTKFFAYTQKYFIEFGYWNYCKYKFILLQRPRSLTQTKNSFRTNDYLLFFLVLLVSNLRLCYLHFVCISRMAMVRVAVRLRIFFL